MGEMKIFRAEQEDYDAMMTIYEDARQFTWQSESMGEILAIRQDGPQRYREWHRLCLQTGRTDGGCVLL